MKKSILTLLVLLTCAVQPTTAYEYFTIYFSDGTKSEAFYATDVDSISYSNIGLDGITYDDLQVQEIYTCDSIYRYPLAQIDSLSFKDVDINKVAEDINRANSVIIPLYAQYESTTDLSQHLSTIRNVEGVEDAWVDGQALYIYIKDYGTITFIYPPQKTIGDVSCTRVMQKTPSKSVSSLANNNQTNIGKVCIFNHMAKDENSGFDDARWVVKELREMYNNMGVLCEIPDFVQPEFFESKMFEYDQLFIITHGTYDNKSKTHWLATDRELLCITNPSIFAFSAQIWKDYLNLIHYSTNKLRIFSHSEIRNGIKCIVFYVAVSEHLISSAKKHFQNTNTMVFNAACESLKGTSSQHGEKTVDYSMGNIFVNKGASCYFGYDDANTIGRYGGFEFFQALLNGSCVESSYNLIDDLLKEEQFDGYHPVLRKMVNNPNLRVLQVETLESENEQTNNSVKLSGRIKKIDSDIIHVDELKLTISGLKEEYKYGFQYSTNSDMSQADSIKAEGKYDSSTLYMNWEATLNESDLQSNTTYYYRAYMNDGYSNCYGEIKQFTTQGDAEPYAVLNDSTLTFYYDNKKEERGGMDVKRFYSTTDDDYVRGWHEHRDSIVVVVFDDSFTNCTSITDTSCWFYRCSKLKAVKGLEKINTTNVTSMYSMFYGCSSLTSLDLSGFNTTNVTAMGRMFSGCSSLTSLDVSNFDTSNLTSMWCMFYGCSSLTSLDLSSFDTSNVTNMWCMFDDCSSLTSLDLSNFDTSNVTGMYSMFDGCSSLTGLDLSNFDTSNVTEMSYMFRGCSSLTSLDLSSFDTSNVTNMMDMFDGCSSLTSLDLSSFDTSNVTNMVCMFRGCSSLTSLDLSNFDTSNLWSMWCMFSGCSSLTSLDVSNFDTSNVTDMGWMFSNCSSLTSLDLSSFNTSNVTDMSGMLANCSSLTDINASNFVFNDQTVWAFRGNHYLRHLNLSNANTSNVTNMHYMFENCSSLTSLDVSNFDTSNVTSMYSMFYGCSSLTSLDLSSFDTSNVTEMIFMFHDCGSLKTIYAGNWNNSDWLFYGCSNLEGGQGTKLGDNLYGYDENGNPLYYYCPDDGSAAHIDGGRDNPGLFTAK